MPVPVPLIALAVLIVIIAGIWFAVLRGLNRGRDWHVGRSAGAGSLRSADSTPGEDLSHAKDANAARTWDPEL